LWRRPRPRLGSGAKERRRRRRRRRRSIDGGCVSEEVWYLMEGQNITSVNVEANC
jgi:hypothetical protein